LGVEGALFRDPAIADKAECDTKRIRDVEQREKPRSAKDDQRSVEMMLAETVGKRHCEAPRDGNSRTESYRIILFYSLTILLTYKSM
jgi:hypothetical protein